jgi:hypothetical protein
MRFTDFLKTAVLLFSASGTVLAAVTILGATSKSDTSLIYFSLAWWGTATLAGIFLGRRMRVTEGIAKLLTDARTTPMLPEVEPGRIIFNRLWLLAVLTIVAGGVAWLVPQVPAVATGYAILAGLGWRRQSSAVLAIEQRDGVQFYVEPTPPLSATKLIRAPGYRKLDTLREPARRPGSPV